MVLITNKQSNILQDIDTLHLLARVVSEHCRTTDEKDVSKNAFEILLAFDEVVSLGYRDNVSLSQIKTIGEMESHEEKIQAEIARNKEKEAKEELNRKMRTLELQKKEMARKGLGTTSSTGFGSGSSYYPSGPTLYANQTKQESFSYVNVRN
jgi:DNA repair protein RadC